MHSFGFYDPVKSYIYMVKTVLTRLGGGYKTLYTQYKLVHSA